MGCLQSVIGGTHTRITEVRSADILSQQLCPYSVCCQQTARLIRDTSVILVCGCTSCFLVTCVCHKTVITLPSNLVCHRTVVVSLLE